MTAPTNRPRRRLGRALTWPVRVLVEPQAPTTVAAFVVLAVLGAGAWLTRDRWRPAAPAAESSATATAQPSAPASAAVTPSATVSPAPVDPSDPFAGTPAAAFPQGEAGIVMPAARALPGLGESQVADGLALVRSALIAARLDRGMLVAHDPTTFVARLAPTNRAWANTAFRDKTFASMATWIDPAVTLSPEQPRVAGSTTFGGGTDLQGRSYLEVTTNYVWVYPFAGGGPGAARTAIVHDEIVWQVRAGPTYATEDRGLWVSELRAFLANVSCAPAREGLIAPAITPASAPTTGPPSPGATPVDPRSYYDPGRDLNVADTCAG